VGIKMTTNLQTKRKNLSKQFEVFDVQPTNCETNKKKKKKINRGPGRIFLQFYLFLFFNICFEILLSYC